MIPKINPTNVAVSGPPGGAATHAHANHFELIVIKILSNQNDLFELQ